MRCFTALIATLMGATVMKSHCLTENRAGPVVTAEVPARIGEPFSLPASVPWVCTPILLKMGKRYRITAEVLGHEYKDWFIPCSPDGPKIPFFDVLFRSPPLWSPARWLGPGSTKRLRILRDSTPERRRASFLTLIVAIGKDDAKANTIVIGSRRDFEAPRSGRLYLFANDWPGGRGTRGDLRFVSVLKSGATALPTYGNNRGALSVTVEEIPGSGSSACSRRTP